MTSFCRGAGYWKLVIEKWEIKRPPQSAIRNPQSAFSAPPEDAFVDKPEAP
jgi:hypothetical protein